MLTKDQEYVVDSKATMYTSEDKQELESLTC
jgi:hypothetical protein